MVIKVKAKHFKGADSTSPTKCALAAALKEHFKTDDVEEYGYCCTINHNDYYHDDYGFPVETIDELVAAVLCYTNVTIRRIRLYTDTTRMTITTYPI